MRISSMTVSGFRAFRDEVTFDLGANALVLVGANGQGKTSFFDAILWALGGRIPRLGDKGTCVSRYALSGHARVSVELCEGDDIFRVTRTTDDETQRLLFAVNGETISDVRSESELCRRLWPEAQFTGNPGEALTGALTRSVYLQQDRVRDFVEADNDRQRFNAISELVGVGRVTELQAELDRSRRAWSKAINQTQTRRDGLEASAAQVRRRIDDLGEEPEVPYLTGVEWSNWWVAIRNSGVDAETPRPDSAGAADSLDGAIRNLDAIRRSERRINDQALEMLGRWEVISALPVSIVDQTLSEELESALERAMDAVDLAEDNLASVREQTAAKFSNLLAEQDSVRARSALAELALGLLEDVCPVCDQVINREELIPRLEALVALEPIEIAPSGELDEALKQKAIADSDLAAAERQLAEMHRSRRESVAQISEFTRDMEALGFVFDDWREAPDLLERRIKEARRRIDALGELRRQGEGLAIKHARSTEESKRRDLDQKLAYITTRVGMLNVDLSHRRRTAETAKRLLKQLREAESRIVEERVRNLSPLLTRIYRRMDPHPSFRDVVLHATTYYGRGRLWPTVVDPIHDIGPQDPNVVLSSSQINVLALSIFLSLNLGLTNLPLTAAFLDDPVQSLDNINLLGLTDLLRRAKAERQVFVSTHDAKLGKLLARKLRPIRGDERTIVTTLQNWSPRGLDISTHDMRRESTELRVVA